MSGRPTMFIPSLGHVRVRETGKKPNNSISDPTGLSILSVSGHYSVIRKKEEITEEVGIV